MPLEAAAEGIESKTFDARRLFSTRTNEKFSDACGLRLLGLRTTLEVLKQLPVILEAKSVDEGD